MRANVRIDKNGYYIALRDIERAELIIIEGGDSMILPTKQSERVYEPPTPGRDKNNLTKLYNSSLSTIREVKQ